MVSAMTAAPCWMASGTTVSSLARPASRLTELTIARPGICSSAVRERERGDLVELVAPGLEVDGVDDRAARDLLEGGLDDIGLGRVDLDGGGLRQGDALDDLAHLLGLVLALGERDADVEHVGAALDLVLGDLHEAVVVVGEQQFLRLARALRVDALADERRARVLHQRRGGDHRAHVRRARRGAFSGGQALDALGDR